MLGRILAPPRRFRARLFKDAYRMAGFHHVACDVPRARAATPHNWPNRVEGPDTIPKMKQVLGAE
jgi:hypothetical protein